MSLQEMAMAQAAVGAAVTMGGGPVAILADAVSPDGFHVKVTLTNQQDGPGLGSAFRIPSD